MYIIREMVLADFRNDIRDSYPEENIAKKNYRDTTQSA